MDSGQNPHQAAAIGIQDILQMQTEKGTQPTQRSFTERRQSRTFGGTALAEHEGRTAWYDPEQV